MNSKLTEKIVVLKLTLSAPRPVLRALGQFVKRSPWEHFAECAIDLDEARLIREGVAELERALREEGWMPR